MKRLALLAAAVLLGAAGKPAAERKTDPRTAPAYTVRTGETLSGIARKVEVPRVLIIEANGLKPPYQVRKGQVLVIPRRRSHTVKAGETGFAIAYEYGVPWDLIAAANGLPPDAKVRSGQKLVIPTAAKPGVVETTVRQAEAEAREAVGGRLVKEAPVRFAWPAPGMVRRKFAPRTAARSHDGIDISGEAGSAVRAAAAGTVAFAAREPRTYGNLVIVDHGKGWFSAYGKLQKVTVKTGEKVRAGERVGLMGNTGSTPQTELHFEIRRRTVPLDPLLLLPDPEKPQASR